ncbi:hypothetical protein MAUB_01430 [Mycolicibacterium aubagnense]|uniref:Uncharacterized protein n=1 Tax=Mycolicibacterium aubagnense TaxID=319707 RepID=A0ABN5YKR9_9MYCO|nr:hypothetical protein MAUB_01430 [Mycolicibacterium aubagnense]
MSRIPCGEVTTTNGGISHFGANVKRVTGPPASRKTSVPVWKLRHAASRSLRGSGLTGGNGSDETSTCDWSLISS